MAAIMIPRPNNQSSRDSDPNLFQTWRVIRMAPARVYLTQPELQTETGQQLLDLVVRIALDGKLDLEEIKELRRWLKQNSTSSLPSVAFLHDIMTRITADKVIDRDELLELHLAIERVIPKSHREPILKARKAVKPFERKAQGATSNPARERTGGSQASKRNRVRDLHEASPCILQGG